MCSSLQLSQIIDLLSNDRVGSLKLLEKEGLLPKNMIPKVKEEKPVSRFASQAAQDSADATMLDFSDCKGTSKNGKITVKDVKDFSASKVKKISASPAAATYAKDHGIDLEEVPATGKDGKITIQDVKKFSTPKEEKAKKGPKLSPGALKLAKQWQLDEDDLAEVKPTGAGDTIKKSDLKELVDAAKKAWAEEESEEDSSEDSDDSKDLD
jgi:pyruvate/2-oxoglutarate dehydrogenase complex dihydrolipoamide acyltransferase (E2) component